MVRVKSRILCDVGAAVVSGQVRIAERREKIWAIRIMVICRQLQVFAKAGTFGFKLA